MRTHQPNCCPLLFTYGPCISKAHLFSLRISSLVMYSQNYKWDFVHYLEINLKYSVIKSCSFMKWENLYPLVPTCVLESHLMCQTSPLECIIKILLIDLLKSCFTWSARLFMSTPLNYFLPRGIYPSHFNK